MVFSDHTHFLAADRRYLVLQYPMAIIAYSQHVFGIKGLYGTKANCTISVIYLTAKETHIFNIHLIPETLIKFYPKWYEHV